MKRQHISMPGNDISRQEARTVTNSAELLTFQYGALCEVKGCNPTACSLMSHFHLIETHTDQLNDYLHGTHYNENQKLEDFTIVTIKALLHMDFII